MAAKSDKDKKPTGRKPSAANDAKATKPDPKPKKALDDDDDDLDDDDDIKQPAKKVAKASPAKKAKDDDDDDDDGPDVDVKDDWEKVEEDEDWDPDFDEFDIPKSKAAKPSSGGSAKTGKKSGDEEFKLDEDFKEFDLFNDTGFDDGDEDDF